MKPPEDNKMRFAELDEKDQVDAEMATAYLQKHVRDLGFSDTAATSLKVQFTKAFLSIDAAGAQAGAGHRLADNKPFYHLEISTDNPDMQNLFFKVAFNCGRIRDPEMPSFGMTMPGNANFALTHDYRDGDVRMKVMKIKNLITIAARI